MTTVEWTAALEVGVAEIDDDHRVLVALLNRVMKATDRIEALSILEEVERYTSYHFEREERLMAEYGYEFTELHRREHRELYYEVKHQIDDLLVGQRALLEIAKFMQRWLLRHIAGEDRLLGQAILRARRAQQMENSADASAVSR